MGLIPPTLNALHNFQYVQQLLIGNFNKPSSCYSNLDYSKLAPHYISTDDRVNHDISSIGAKFVDVMLQCFYRIWGQTYSFKTEISAQHLPPLKFLQLYIQYWNSVTREEKNIITQVVLHKYSKIMLKKFDKMNIITLGLTEDDYGC